MRASFRWSMVVVIFSALPAAWSEGALAQSEAPASSPPSPRSDIGDVVQLKDGSVFRGVIIELVPDDHVSLRLPSGEAKRFPAADVVFAGPASAAPGAAPATAGPSSKVVVRVVGNTPNLQFLFRDARTGPEPTLDPTDEVSRFSATCLAPCELQLPRGDYYVGLSRNGGNVHENRESVALQSPSTVQGTYHSKGGARVVGIVLLSTLVPVGLLLVLTGASVKTQTCSPTNCSTQSTGDGTIIGLGATTALLGLVAGIPLVLMRDEVEVQLAPRVSARIDLRLPTSERAPDRVGLAAQIAF